MLLFGTCALCQCQAFLYRNILEFFCFEHYNYYGVHLYIYHYNGIDLSLSLEIPSLNHSYKRFIANISRTYHIFLYLLLPISFPYQSTTECFILLIEFFPGKLFLRRVLCKFLFVKESIKILLREGVKFLKIIQAEFSTEIN